MKKKVIAALLCGLMLMNTAACAGAKNTKKDNSTSTDYATKLFDQSYVHEVNIEISDADWQDLRTNPLNKTKYEVNITIDGEKISDVSFATKGNTSLSSVASDEDSDRYSFKVNFGKYVEGQTYYGLDKLNLNNIYADATYMKDYLSYEIFRAVGVEAPLTSYVNLKINGESFGLYLAIEDVGESYLDRTENSDSELYKPETEMLGNMDKVNNPGENAPDGQNGTNPDASGSQNGTNPDASGSQNGTNPDASGSQNGSMPNMPEGQQGSVPGNPGDGNFPTNPGDGNFPTNPGDGNFPTNPGGDIGNIIGGIFGSGDSGASLKYTDDKLDSYSDIFNNAETEVTDEDKQRVIAALKALSENKADQALDITEVISYFVAHNFVLNYDSYTGSMLHNYYLMETDGKLSVIPWDYNLAFGAFSGAGAGGDGATSLINTGIDSPLSGANSEDRPLWNVIVSNEEYLKQYHEIYSKLMEYINSGKLETEMNRVYNMIHSYVENDKSAFYSVSEFEQGYKTLAEFVKLRAESITKQLSGQLSTITTDQKAEDKVDASSININSMGSQGGGKMDMPGFDGQNGNPDFNGSGQNGNPDFNGSEQNGNPDQNGSVQP